MPHGVHDCPVARSHEAVTVAFADITGFTQACSELSPSTVMSFLNDLFLQFDALVEHFGVYKVETIGDCCESASHALWPPAASAVLQPCLAHACTPCTRTPSPALRLACRPS